MGFICTIKECIGFDVLIEVVMEIELMLRNVSVTCHHRILDVRLQ
jgi:hypothetical protein